MRPKADEENAMKIVFLALLLLNLGLLAWHFWVAPPPVPPTRQTAAPEVPRLKLWQGAPENPSPPFPGPESARSPAPVTASLRRLVADTCAEYGPFGDRSAATQLAARLDRDGAATVIVARRASVAGGYWVYFPPYSSHDAAKAMAAKLRQRGVKDLFIVADGKQRNAISVGVFSDEAGARRRRKHLVELGFKPLLGRRMRDEDRYWLQAKRQAALPEPASLAMPGQRLERRALDCGDIAIAAANP